MTRAQLDKKPGDVAAMFDGLADRYDLLNDVLSAGQDRRWRRIVAAAVGAGPGERVLDIAAGTGTSSRAFTSAGAQCVACDFSLGMLRAGAAKPAARVRFVAGDALGLPFQDLSFDAVTISFGLRNVVDPDAALNEMLRVTRPGGRLVVCEFSHLPARRLDAGAGVLRRRSSTLCNSTVAISNLSFQVSRNPPRRRRQTVPFWRRLLWGDSAAARCAVTTLRRPGGACDALPQRP